MYYLIFHIPQRYSDILKSLIKKKKGVLVMFANCCPSFFKSDNLQLPHWRWLSEKRRVLGALPRLR